MADIWLPGFERWPFDSAPGLIYDEPNDPKAVAHTTEGVSIESAVSAYRAYPPQLIVDPAKKRKVQHIPVNRGGYALWNGDADDSRCIQVEIVGYASQTHTWPDEWLRWLGKELALPLHEYAGVPYRVVWKGFKRAGETGYVLASPSSPLRLTQAELDTFSGWLGHQHIPGDSHWDPGGLNVPKILEYAQEEDMPTADEIATAVVNKWLATEVNRSHDGDEPAVSGKFRIEWLLAATDGHTGALKDLLRKLHAKVDAGFAMLSDDEAMLLAEIRKMPTGAQVDVEALAAQLRGSLGDVLADELAARLAGSPT
jgi:hypothetical protein